jgi:hypothetical protein
MIVSGKKEKVKVMYGDKVKKGQRRVAGANIKLSNH